MNDILYRLSLSKFRTSFKLKDKDIEYIDKNGFEKIKSHAYDFLNKRERIKLANDGKQTPTKGHPVFIAQHATATCCRGCIRKWYKIPEEKELTEDDIEYLISIIMEWIKREYIKAKNNNKDEV